MKINFQSVAILNHTDKHYLKVSKVVRQKIWNTMLWLNIFVHQQLKFPFPLIKKEKKKNPIPARRVKPNNNFVKLLFTSDDCVALPEGETKEYMC